MKKYLLMLIACTISLNALCQNKFTVIVKDSKTNEPLIGVTVAIGNLNKAGSTNETIADLSKGYELGSRIRLNTRDCCDCLSIVIS